MSLKVENMKKSLVLLTSLLALCSLTGCNQEVRHKLNEITSYVFEVPTYTELDEKYADDYFKQTYYNWGGGCSAIAKTILDPGEGSETSRKRTIVGRNMDLNISNKCAYIVRTEVPGKNKTFGLAYTFREISEDYNIVKEKGISDQLYKVLPFLCDDVMNDKGLYVEINMRNGEYWPSGEDKFACSGTNPYYKDKTVYMFELPRYIAENCSRVSEVEEYVKGLNIYSKEYYWNYAFIIADRSGDYGLLELANNRIYWIPGQDCQTNFYINENCNAAEELPCGIGRYNYLKKHIDGVNTKQEMFDLMKDVSYSQIYNARTCKFDCRSEMIGSLPWLDYSFLMAMDEYKEAAIEMMYEATADVRAMTREEKANLNQYWESSFTEVADTKEMTIQVRFFENESKVYEISFTKIRKLLTE
mgnify:CR=1 FL=1